MANYTFERRDVSPFWKHEFELKLGKKIPTEIEEDWRRYENEISERKFIEELVAVETHKKDFPQFSNKNYYQVPSSKTIFDTIDKKEALAQIILDKMWSDANIPYGDIAMDEINYWRSLADEINITNYLRNGIYFQNINSVIPPKNVRELEGTIAGIERDALFMIAEKSPRINPHTRF